MKNREKWMELWEQASTEQNPEELIKQTAEIIRLLGEVGVRLEGPAERHPLVLEQLLAMAENVRSVALAIAVLVATKLHGSDGHTLTPPHKPV